ncbi:MAG: glycerol-3-phosphate 1-O-acyltransferase PlsY [Fimbriimonadaceae bacterium]|nr:glycerol-3-phosphate 1-O-acyltransferase PlsY [Fimbriimonadaceae bacterium]QYK57273.1 MAG: glycerol-3-phosphate 1-O-acyltransferase PlsY [Fimbriimonadaceae bacterium]
MIEFFIASLAAFLVGSFPFGKWVALARGIDITSQGSGNIGATNVFRVLGPRDGIVVFALDVLKGVGPALFFPKLTPESVVVLSQPDQALVFGALAIIGHTLSPFVGFKGGKGIATGLGALLGTAPIVGTAGFGGFVVAFLLTRIVSVSSLIGASTVLVAAVLTGQSRLFLGVYGLMVAYVFWKHRANIGRLLRGEEPRLELGRRRSNTEEAK